MVQYLGLDWAYRRAAWCAVGEGGAVSGEGVVSADEDGLARLVLAALLVVIIGSSPETATASRCSSAPRVPLMGSAQRPNAGGGLPNSSRCSARSSGGGPAAVRVTALAAEAPIPRVRRAFLLAVALRARDDARGPRITSAARTLHLRGITMILVVS